MINDGEKLFNKVIKSATITGHMVKIEFTDGTSFNYYASDGGYSCWNIKEVKENDKV